MTLELTPVIIALIAGLPAILAAIAAILVLFRQKQLNTVTGEKLQEIHVLVNNRLTEALEKIEDLESAMGGKKVATAILEEKKST